MVYAFKSDAPVKINKSWGNSEGKRGDWVVMSGEEDIYCCGSTLFEESYEPVPNKLHQYRKKTTVYARKFNEAFTAVTIKPGHQPQRQNGPAGSYLVQADITVKQEVKIDEHGGAGTEGIDPALIAAAQHSSRSSIMTTTKYYEQYVLNENDFNNIYEVSHSTPHSPTGSQAA